jgi:hypothetical protein
METNMKRKQNLFAAARAGTHHLYFGPRCGPDLR